nr:hypothetical protein [Rhodococcus qingshengii]
MRTRFVDEAPEATRERRELIFDAVQLHIKLLRRLFRGHPVRLWINGGFTTHKAWTPRDADLAVIVPPEAYSKAEKDVALPLWTLSDVEATRGTKGIRVVTPKMHTMGGLTDAYVFRSDRPHAIELIRRDWSLVKTKDGTTVPGQAKGIVEVLFDE